MGITANTNHLRKGRGENVVTSLGDQGVVFHIASFWHRFHLVLVLATSLSLVLHLHMYLPH